jgi:flagellar biosynthesis protein FlhF
MNEALDLVRRELGPHAVIVSTVDADKGVEVTAALESRDEESMVPLDIAQTGSALFRLNQLTLLCELHRLPERVRDHWLEIVASYGESQDDVVSDSLGQIVSFDERPLFEPAYQEPLVFIGTHGSGKTLTLAKTAVMYLTQGYSVRILTTDATKSCGYLQLKTYAQAMGKEVECVATRDELRKLFSNAAGEIILIDTPGINPYDSQEIYQLKDLLSGLPARTFLTLQAGLDAKESGEITDRLSQLRASFLIVTRCDCARNLSGPLSAAYDSNLLLVAFSEGAELMTSLKPLTALKYLELMTRIEN